MNLVKRIAKFLHAATAFRNPAGNVTVSLSNAFTTTAEYMELAADTLVGVEGARLRIYKPSATTDKAIELLVGTTVIGVLFQNGSTSLGGNFLSSLSPAFTGTTPHMFFRPHLGIVNTGGGSVTEALSYNSYLDGGTSRAVFAGIGLKLFFSAANAAVIISTAPSVAAGAVQTFTARFSVPVAGRQWVNVTGSRAFDTVYQNTTGYEIELGITVSHSATSSVDIKVDTATPPAGIVGRSSTLTLNSIVQLTATVPNLGYYELDTIAAGASLVNWMELR